MGQFRKPLIFALIGAVAGMLGYGLSLVLGMDLQAPFAVIVLAAAVGGFIGGWIRQRRGK
ncbi:MAG: hypothetical protein NXH74_01460 [Rhodobacteraceae bacterium]|jgi:uncharacterized integral membrane protein|nr:hypothetical protein [Paracoccaceae bacterium]